MSEILITGGAGYIGSHAVKRFLEEGHNVTVIDNLSTGYSEPLEILANYGHLHFVQGNLLNEADLDKAFGSNRIDTVLHFAALCSVNESMQEPGLYFKNNLCGSVNLLKAIRKYDVRNFILSSTCAVYGTAQYLPIDESHPKNPTNPYGESKLMMEKAIDWYSKIYGLRAVILRYFNVCGADIEGVIGDSKKPSPHLVQNIVRGALGLNKFELTCAKVETRDGTPIRDYLDIADLIDAHYLAFNYLNNGGNSIELNLGTGKGYSVLEIINTVEEILSTKIERKQGEERKGEYPAVYANLDKAKSVLGWEPHRTLEDSVKTLKKWYESKPNGYSY